MRTPRTLGYPTERDHDAAGHPRRIEDATERRPASNDVSLQNSEDLTHMKKLHLNARMIGGSAILTFAATLASAAPAAAQADLLGPGAAYISAGISLMSTGALDDRLDERGYPTFGRSATAFGIGGYRVLSSSVMLGLEANPFFIGEESRAEGDVSLGGGFATLGVGYAIPITRRVRVYPRIGIGAGGLTMEFETATDSVDFDDMLDAPTPAPIEPDAALSRDGIVFDVGGGAELLTGGNGGVLIGLRAGYLFAPWDDEWDLVYQGHAIGGPDASIAGPYVRLAVGWAWRL